MGDPVSPQGWGVPVKVLLKRGGAGAVGTDMQDDVHGAGYLLAKQRAKRRAMLDFPNHHAPFLTKGLNVKLLPTMGWNPFAIGETHPIFTCMKNRFLSAITVVFLAATGSTGSAQEAEAVSVLDRWSTDPSVHFDGSEINLNDFIWQARVLIVFADTPNDPLFQRQIELLDTDLAALAERDVVIVMDSDGQSRSDLRNALRPRGFGLVLVDKDGRVALRKPQPWDIREISRVIDSTPLRQLEIEERRVSQ